jgi:hypothetical protein
MSRMPRAQVSRRAGRPQAGPFPMELPPTCPPKLQVMVLRQHWMFMPLGKPLTSPLLELTKPHPSQPTAMFSFSPGQCGLCEPLQHMAQGWCTEPFTVPLPSSSHPQTICLPDAEFQGEHACQRKSGSCPVVSTLECNLSCQHGLEHMSHMGSLRYISTDATCTKQL